MGRYVLRRILVAVPVFFLVTVIVFGFLRVGRGEPEVVSRIRESSQAQAEELKREMRLDRPIPVQYGYWVRDIGRGDLGKSDLYGFSVGDLLRDRFPNTLRLGLIALLVALLVGVPLGILSAVKIDRLPDYIFRSIAVLFLAIPSFWLALLVIVVPARLWGVSPPLIYVPFSEDPVQNVTFFLLPGTLLGLHLVGVTLRMTRSMMLEVLTSDYVRTARAKGLPGRLVLGRHALRNVLIPIVTILGAQGAWLVGGSVVIESIFSVPGVGALLVESVRYKDFHVVQGATVFLAGFVLALNLVIDLSYGFIDPRIRLASMKP